MASDRTGRRPNGTGDARQTVRQKERKDVRKKPKYEKDLPRRLYTYFLTYDDVGAPSFTKFAHSIGVTLEDIKRWTKNTEFMRAYRECNEIRRDYLIDNALGKRCDASTAKFILSAEYGMGEEVIDEEAKRLDVRIEVVDK